MRNVISRGFVVLAGLLAVSSNTHPEPLKMRVNADPDPRLPRLRQFFKAHHSPISNLAEEFLIVADRNALDWRLLPSLAMVESGGGKDYRNNNIFGWANGKFKFRSVRHGIRHVANYMGKSAVYRNKPLPEVLWAYNPRIGFRQRVEDMMESLEPNMMLASR